MHDDACEDQEEDDEAVLQMMVVEGLQGLKGESSVRGGSASAGDELYDVDDAVIGALIRLVDGKVRLCCTSMKGAMSLVSAVVLLC